MSKLDSKNRIHIPANFTNKITTDYKKEVRLYLTAKECFIDNPSIKNRYTTCLAKIYIDDEYTFELPEHVLKMLNITSSTNILIYLSDGKIFFRTIFFIPEHR